MGISLRLIANSLTDNHMGNHRLKIPLLAFIIAGTVLAAGIIPARAADVEAVGVPLTVRSDQSGRLQHDFGLLNHVELDWPLNTLDYTATVRADFLTASSSGISNRLPQGASLASDGIFRLTVTNPAGMRELGSFDKEVTLNLYLPLPGDLSNVGAYYLDETANRWIRVADVDLDAATGQATIIANHLGTFAIFRATGLPASLSIQGAGTPPSAGSDADIAAFVAWEKARSGARSQELTRRLSGRILLQVEQRGEAWYVDPKDGQRYFLDSPLRSLETMGKMAVGVSESAWRTFSNVAPENLAGRFLIRTESDGRLYYVNPQDRSFRYIATPLDAWRLMGNVGLGIMDVNLRKITVGNMR